MGNGGREPATDSSGWRLALKRVTDEKATLVLSAGAQAKWDRFVTNANPETGTTHPADRKSWAEFLTTAHRDGCLPATPTLEGYLLETLKWAPRAVENMARELEFAKALLDVK